MSLGARDERVLDSIGARLARSDPRLAGLLGIFGRLAAGEDMPQREQIRARARWVPAVRHRRRGSRRRGQGPARRGLARAVPVRVMLALGLFLTVCLISVAVALNAGGSGATCQAAWTSCAPAPRMSSPGGHGHSPR
jgi:hypothetical protein